MSPKFDDIFYLRRLLANKTGATSFEALRTIPTKFVGTVQEVIKDELLS